MDLNNDSLEKLRIVQACQKLLHVRFQYAWITYVFCNDHVNKKDIADAAQRIQSKLNDIINAALHCLLHSNEGAGTSQVYSLLESARLQARELHALLRQTVPGHDIPSGIHPDDWAWMEDMIND